MQSVCLLFAGRRGLDNQESRQSILRIPEVSRRLQSVQKILDQAESFEPAVDLYSFVLSNDTEFNSQQNLKSLVSAVIQVGLFDRFVKFRSRPQFLVGLNRGCAAVKVCSRKQSLEDLVFTSEYFKKNQGVINLSQPQEVLLSGRSLEEYGLYQWNNKGDYEFLETDSKDPIKIVGSLSAENLVNQCIHIGPYFDFRLKEFESLENQNIPSMSSIELDPILNSFWKSA